MPDPHATDWWTLGGAVLGGGVLSHVANWLTGRRKIAAETVKIAAETANLDAQAEKNLEDFVNDRVKAVINGLEIQVKGFQARLERQEKDCQEREDRQNRTIQRLEDEIQALRKALDERPRPGPIPIGI